MLADTTQYPLADIFLSIIEFFLLFLWIFLLITVFFDLFRSHDLKGWHKAIWVIVLIIFPFLGVLAYLILRGGGMHQRQVEQAKRQDEALRAYIRETAGAGAGGAAAPAGSSGGAGAGAASGHADQLAQLARLKEQGVLTEDEFQKAKAKILT